MKRVWLCLTLLGCLAGCAAPAASPRSIEREAGEAAEVFVPHVVNEEILGQEYAEFGT